MDEMNASVKVSSENGHQAAQLAQGTHAMASRGETEIKALIESILSLSADSKKMTEIIRVIDDIAFQTNLLALNASVEAARAGEQGKGFAVVADAVRTLSQKTTAAAKDISQLINASVDKIENGAQQAEQGGKVLGEIVTSVKKVSELTIEISHASDEQTRGISQISGAMNTLEQVGQENAAASEEAAAAAEELSAQSESLRQNAEVLNREVYGAVKAG
jgi:methyl-accepting chemotaxis protein